MQYDTSQICFGGSIAHNRVRNYSRNAQGFNLLDKVSILSVDDHDVEEVVVAACNTNGRDLMTHAAHQLIGGTFNGCSSDDWAYSDHRTIGLVEYILDAWNGQDGADTDDRVTGGNENSFSLFQGIEYTWSWFCFVGPDKYDILYF